MNFNIIYNKIKKSGFSGKEIAEKSGVDASTLSRWASGKSQARFSEVMIICRAFDISVDDFLYKDKQLDSMMMVNEPKSEYTETEELLKQNNQMLKELIEEKNRLKIEKSMFNKR